MDVVIIGTGNVAAVLGRLMVRCGHTVLQVWGRNEQHAIALANELGCTAIANLKDIAGNASLYMIAVADKAIEHVASSLSLNNRLVVHTAGSVSRNVLKSASDNYGVIYPLQSIRKENEHIPVIPLLVDGSDEAVTTILLSFAQTLSAVTGVVNDEQRLSLHIGAVVTSNFTNHLYTLAKSFCEKQNVPFGYLLPLIEETATRLRHHAPEGMQTGPAVRSDVTTIQNHLVLLSSYPQLQQLYKIMSESITAHHS
ncbi:Rossmann-like and DUF2520 domain-containing protein [Foetidibacter luteolus]|uniref:Rossmann-like and DUF2520 domain-containing protein n=1 Tax=Foetidibacter luteolus TaxID=2608880 RepID=UPI00129A1C79|nr:Rossmann-like and DUF2520 domain-containing protein [Foetidibacter luteolus]